MACTKCGAENAPAARFCRGCGSPLNDPAAAAGPCCPQCEHLCSPAAKFCPKCGHSFLQADISPLPAPKTPVPEPPPPVAKQQPKSAARPVAASSAARSHTPMIIAVVAVIAIVVAGGGVYYWKFMRVSPAGDAAAPSGSPVAPATEMPVEPPVLVTPAPDPEPQPAEFPATVATDGDVPEVVVPVAPPVPAAPPPPAAPPGLQPEIAARIGTMLSQGREYGQQLQYDKAIATAESVLLIDPGNRDARRLMKEAKDGQQAALNSIEID